MAVDTACRLGVHLISLLPPWFRCDRAFVLPHSSCPEVIFWSVAERVQPRFAFNPSLIPSEYFSPLAQHRCVDSAFLI